VTTASAVEANELILEALGSRFVITCASALEAAVLRQQWSRLRANGTAMPTDMPIDLRSMPEDQQGRALLSEVTSRAIEAAAGTRLMLHAAGIADADGLVMTLVGPSGMGKTTAASYLCRNGFGYVTDETVSIGPDGDVLPFGRPLSLRRPGGEIQRSPDELGLGRPSGVLNIARIVLLDRVPGRAGAPTLTAVPLVNALLELIPQTSALAKLPDPVQFMSRTIDRCRGVLRLTYGEMDERVLSLISELSSRQVEPRDPWHALVPPQPRSDGVASRGCSLVDDQELFQGNVLDGVATDGEVLVLVGHVPVRLGGIGVDIWEAARDGIATSEIVSMVEREHGAHPDAQQIVREAVDQMLEAGLLVARADQLPMSAAASR
jgi:hypothetical protein